MDILGQYHTEMKTFKLFLQFASRLSYYTLTVIVFLHTAVTKLFKIIVTSGMNCRYATANMIQFYESFQFG